MAEASGLAEAILEQIAEAIIFTDRTGTIVRWNRGSTALFGYPAEEALGQSVDLIIPEHLRAGHWRGFNAAMSKGALKLQGRSTLTRALHKSGRRLYVEMTFAVVRDADRKVLGSVAMARDVTERVERERTAPRDGDRQEHCIGGWILAELEGGHAAGYARHHLANLLHLERRLHALRPR